MSPRVPRSNGSDVPAYDRRRFIAIGAGVGAALLAGCSADPGDDGTGGDGDGGSGGTSEPAGTFRLLISDQPVAIDDFDSLEVSFEHARVFRGEGEDGEGDTPTPTATATPTETTTGTPTETTASPTPTATETETETETEDDEGPDDGQRGFFVLDLDGATVDLTKVVGDKAMGVFEGELPEGRYTKIELHVADVGGVVGGDPVDVKVPSQKLQITKPFEVVAGETLSFVFDINVVKKGQSGGYNLLPVISGSGVVGKDVEVEEVGDDGADGDDDGDAEETDEESDGPPDGDGGGDGGPPEETTANA